VCKEIHKHAPRNSTRQSGVCLFGRGGARCCCGRSEILTGASLPYSYSALSVTAQVAADRAAPGCSAWAARCAKLPSNKLSNVPEPGYNLHSSSAADLHYERASSASKNAWNTVVYHVVLQGLGHFVASMNASAHFIPSQHSVPLSYLAYVPFASSWLTTERRGTHYTLVAV
jgi:hypothetical protein